MPLMAQTKQAHKLQNCLLFIVIVYLNFKQVTSLFCLLKKLQHCFVTVKPQKFLCANKEMALISYLDNLQKSLSSSRSIFKGSSVKRFSVDLDIT